MDWIGFTTDFINVEHAPRYEGKTTYNYRMYLLSGINTLYPRRVGVYLAHTFDEVKKRPLYLVDQETASVVDQKIASVTVAPKPSL